MMKTLRKSPAPPSYPKSIFHYRKFCIRLAVCVCTLLWLPRWAHAQNSETAPPAQHHHDIISNQSVSIDLKPESKPVEMQSKTDAQWVINPPSVEEKNIPEDIQNDPSSVDADAVKTAAVIPVRRLPRRLTGVTSEASPAVTHSVPWYRSGLGALAIVMCVMAGIYWFIRRWVPSIRVSQSGVVQVVARIAITPKHQAALIQLGRRFVLVGISGDRVRTLCEVTHPEEVAELTARVGVTHLPRAAGFENLLSREVGDYLEPSSEQELETLPAGDRRRSHRSGWLKTPALSELKNRLRSLQRRSS